MTLPLILAMGAITFFFRLSFIGLLGRREIPPRWVPLIRLLPIAALTALAVPEFFYHTHQFSLTDGRWLAGLVAVFVAWRTRSILPTLISGMLALWLWQSFIR